MARMGIIACAELGRSIDATTHCRISARGHIALALAIAHLVIIMIQTHYYRLVFRFNVALSL